MSTNPNCHSCGRQSYTVGATHCGYCGVKLRKRGPAREYDFQATLAGLVDQVRRLTPNERLITMRELKKAFPSEWNTAIQGRQW